MGKTLETVMGYANEDYVSIRKHWIIIVKTVISVIIQIGVVTFLYFRYKNFLEGFADELNQAFVEIPFEIKKYILPVIVLYTAYVIAKQFIDVFIEYTTVGLSLNNIQIKGKSGLIGVGIVNAPLKQIDFVRVHKSFFGQLLSYGTIEISIGGRAISMAYMVRADEFQDAIILLQEAQKEGRNIRQAERHEKTIAKQTMAQVQALNVISQHMAAGVEQKKKEAIEHKRETTANDTSEE